MLKAFLAALRRFLDRWLPQPEPPAIEPEETKEKTAAADNGYDVFHYHDGERERRIDPLAAWRKIWNHPDCDIASDIKIAQDPTKSTDGEPMFKPADVFAAEDRINALVRDVFGVKAYNGEDQTGLTVERTQELLTDYFTWMNERKKKRSS